MASADSAGKSKLYSLKSIYVLDQGLRIQDQYGQMLYTVVSVFDSMKPVIEKTNFATLEQIVYLLNFAMYKSDLSLLLYITMNGTRNMTFC